MKSVVALPLRRAVTIRYAGALGACALATGVVLAFPRALWLPSGVLVYLVAVLGVATLAGRGPGVAAAIVSFAAFDWFFTEPRFTFTVRDPNEWVALVAYLVVGGVGSQLAARQRERLLDVGAREREARLLHDLSDLLGDRSFDDALAAAAERVRGELGADAVVIAIDRASGVQAQADAGGQADRKLLRSVLAGPVSVLGEGQRATATRPGTPGRWMRVLPAYRPSGPPAPRDVARVPIRRDDRVLGQVLVKWPAGSEIGPRQARLLDTVADQLAAASEREMLRSKATEAEVLRRTSELKSALLDAVSHDLRTPLASIIGSADSLLQADVDWPDDARQEFLQTIEQEAQRLNRIVGNLLDLSRIQGGVIVPAKDWHDPALLLRETLARLEPATRDHRLLVDVPDDMPPVLIDPVEIDQVVANLVENAAKYSPPGGEIRVTAHVDDGTFDVTVDDDGPGIPEEALPRLFEPFYRASATRAIRGSGLGLAVARGLVAAHGGHVWASNLDGHGTRFAFSIPTPAAPLQKEG